MLLDIFAGKTNDDLSRDGHMMKELLEGHLDRLLMPISEFMRWRQTKLEQLERIE